MGSNVQQDWGVGGRSQDEGGRPRLGSLAFFWGGGFWVLPKRLAMGEVWVPVLLPGVALGGLGEGSGGKAVGMGKTRSRGALPLLFLALEARGEKEFLCTFEEGG